MVQILIKFIICIIIVVISILLFFGIGYLVDYFSNIHKHSKEKAIKYLLKASKYAHLALVEVLEGNSFINIVVEYENKALKYWWRSGHVDTLDYFNLLQARDDVEIIDYDTEVIWIQNAIEAIDRNICYVAEGKR